MKILIVTQLYPLSQESQDSKALHYFAKEWKKNHEVKVLRPYFFYEKVNRPDTGSIKIEDIEVNVFSPQWIPILKISRFNCKRIFEELNFFPDVIVAHLYHSYMNFSKLANDLKIPIVIGIHKSDIRLLNNVFHRVRLAKAIKSGNAIAFRSIPLQNKLKRIVKDINLPEFIASSGVPEEFFKYAFELQSKGYLYTNKKKLISVCQLIKLKQVDKVIHSLKALSDKGYSAWEYTIVGDGPEMNKLKKIVNLLGMYDKIFFKGRLSRSDVFRELKSHDFFVMPSYKETFGIAYLEAMAAGCIVIGSKGWGIDGIVSHKTNGLLCDPYNQSDITNVIEFLLKVKHEVLVRLKQESLNTVINFSEKKMANNYLDFINSIVLRKKIL